MPRTFGATLLACAIAGCVVGTACGGDVSARDTQQEGSGQATAALHAEGITAALADTLTNPGADHGLTSAAVLPDIAAGQGRAAVGAAPATHVAVLFSDLDAELGPMIDGVIRSVHADLGDAVRAGQVLAVLNDGRQQARVAAATAARDLARAEFARAEGLLERGFLTGAQHEEALYRLRVAEATLSEAEVELDHTRVRAPFHGVVTRRMTGAGRSVETADPLFRVTALRPLRALVRVPEHAARTIAIGAAAILSGEGGEQVPSTVIRISPAVDPASGTIEILLGVPDPGPLRPGSSALVRFLTQMEPRRE